MRNETFLLENIEFLFKTCLAQSQLTNFDFAIKKFYLQTFPAYKT